VSRLLDPPTPIDVDVDEGIPRRVRMGPARQLEVTAVLARWRVEADWWRQPLSREYWKLGLGDGRVVEAFEDRTAGSWRLTRIYD